MKDRPDFPHDDAFDRDVPETLKALLAPDGADPSTRRQMLAALVARPDADEVLLGALGLGGTPLALTLAQAQARTEDRALAVDHLLAVFFAAAESPDAPQRAQHLVDRFGLEVAPTALFDLMRADILIHEGPLEELSEALLTAMRLGHWSLALEGVRRLRSQLGERTPRAAYGVASVCLHRLGRYAEADQWVLDGLGPQRVLLQPPEVFTEEQLIQRWGGATRPVVSIICIAYNHERYIESALRGFLSQDCRHPFEILIHDDASTDRTADIIRQWQARYPTIIKPVLQTQNQYSRGVRPFELMLGRATGDFVAACEGDDFWIHPGKLQRQVDVLLADPALSCTAHNYYHFHEGSLHIKPWTSHGRDFVISQRQLMSITLLLWLPTLVFRRRFNAFPPERDFAALGDAFLTSYLGTQGTCAYLETLHGAVRRENEFSLWSPLASADKQAWCIKTWAALVLMHERLGNTQAVQDLQAKIAAFAMPAATKQAVIDGVNQAARRRQREAA